VGSESWDELVWSWIATEVSVPQKVEMTPSATDCLVVVAGVSVGGRAFASATEEPWWLAGGAGKSESDGAGEGSLVEFEFGAELGIVGSPLLSCRSMHGRYSCAV
jgi:hypothetical protein